MKLVDEAEITVTAGNGGNAGAKAGGGPGGQGGGDRPTAVTTLRLRLERFAERYSAIGTVKARESVTVTAKVSEIVQQVQQKYDREVPSTFVGEQVMRALNQLDPVAYVRFASVYRDFKDVTEFMDELKSLVTHKP